MIEGIILGVIQGVVEWLPVSSEGVLVLINTHFLGGESLVESVQLALFLHLGTFFAALVYFWSDVVDIFKTLFTYKKAEEEKKKLFNFLFISTLISGVLGLGLLKIIGTIEGGLESYSGVATGFVGVLLLVTGYLLLLKKTDTYRESKDLNIKDSLILGITQGFASMPGLSRSGLTVSALLLRKINEREALRISFLMSLPIVLGGNIILNMNSLEITGGLIAGLIASFVVGLATIHVLLKVAKNINFGKWVIGFGVLMIMFAFLL